MVSVSAHVPRPPMKPLQLICFPYAGGGASIFRSWGAPLAPDIEVCATTLPGRDSRFCEEPIRRLEGLVDCCFEELRERLRPPFAFFGHSMGSLIAYELARRLQRERMPSPVCLVVSAHRAPHLPSPYPPIHDLPTPALLEELQEYNGTPAEVLRDAELMELLLPMIRADFAVCETYEHLAGEPLDCPLLAFGGDRDEWVPVEHVEAWAEHTAARFKSFVLPGDHFFLHDHREAMLAIIRRELVLAGELASWSDGSPVEGRELAEQIEA
jgi:medium-chain acyl-[acyl-carrier-protein] hydrolase